MKTKKMLSPWLLALLLTVITFSGCKKEPSDFLPGVTDKNGGAMLPTGASGTINCATAVVNGAYKGGIVLTSSNTVILSVTVTVTGTYTISTNTVNGYSFSASGTFSSTGVQSVTLQGTGTPATTGINQFTVTFGSSTCTFKVVVVSANPIYQTSCGTSYVYYEVANQKTLKVWLDRNLGASQVATSGTDYLAYGSLYQWGRLNDSHQCITWTGPTSGTPVYGTTTTKSSRDVPGHSLFIKVSTSPWDWRSPQNHNLWQGVSGINNPCPAGFRLPTSAELGAERASWSQQNASGAFASPLKWVMAGYRDFPDGNLYMPGTAGGYWSSSKALTTKAIILWIDPTTTYTLDDFRAVGYSVRAIKN